ncbi:MAG: N-acetylglucosamine transferase [Alphaproteobacteria bacterium]|nr:N-acetylglucosamine transferase [Alphaproteobacteria bacterium]
MSDNVFQEAVKKITGGAFSLVELIEAATVLAAGPAPALAVDLYKIWAEFNREHPQRYVTLFNCAALQTKLGDLAGSKENLEKAIACNPDFHPAYINLGGVLERLGAGDAGIATWASLAKRLEPVTSGAVGFKAEALKQISRVLLARLQPANAETVLRQCLDVDARQREVIEQFVAVRLTQCKWPVLQPWERVERRTLGGGIHTLSLAAYADDPMIQLAAATNYYKQAIPLPQPGLPTDRRNAPIDRTSRRLRIGYVSSDYREHAIGFLMPEVFELHDRSAFEVFVYYCGIPASDGVNARYKASVEHWRDIRGLDDQAAARIVADDGIDILIDVNGYTKDARTSLFAHRVAPIGVNWLGYPGTMGSPHHHYIIADPWIIPPELEPFYSERVLRLPCYQPNDRKRVVAPQRPTRAEAGLPEDAMVFCCFNGTQKITRFTFDRWLTILSRVPGSVLWLLAGPEGTRERLCAHAEQRGIAASRIVFAEKIANPFHLARYPLADLFLDTAPYGAHTTASDALWMGVPVLTWSGRSFASRVCGSLVRSAGLPELVAASPEAFVERAVALAQDRAQLASLRARLESQRPTCTLFDMGKLVRGLEGLFVEMAEAHQRGQTPRPDLANLDIYFEVGLEADHDAVEFGTLSDPDGWYRERLARRHAGWAIAADNRLWRNADIARVEPTVVAPAFTPAKRRRQA